MGIGIAYPTAIIQHRIPLPSLSSYPDGMASVETLAWEVGAMVEVLGVRDTAASDVMQRVFWGVGRREEEDGRRGDRRECEMGRNYYPFNVPALFSETHPPAFAYQNFTPTLP